jgi:hypothetical protein
MEYVPTGSQNKLGFLVKRTEVDSTLFLEENQRPTSCLFQNSKLIDVANGDRVVAVSGQSLTEDFVISKGQEGFYNTYFVNCLGKDVSFDVSECVARAKEIDHDAPF